jgi:hypothetical protein
MEPLISMSLCIGESLQPRAHQVALPHHRREARLMFVLYHTSYINRKSTRQTAPMGREENTNDVTRLVTFRHRNLGLTHYSVPFRTTKYRFHKYPELKCVYDHVYS